MTTLRDLLKKQKTAIGTAVSINSTAVSECVSSTGLDWIFFDMEHAPLSYADVQNMIQAMRPGCLSFIRMEESTALCVKKCLDTGCDGIIAPRVNDVATAEMLVQAAMYPPTGQRSVGISRSSSYGYTLSDAIVNDNKRISVNVQIEDAAAVAVVNDIAKVEGLDGLYVGPYDLSGSYGVPGDLADKRVVDAIAKVLATANAHDLVAGIFCGTEDMAHKMRDTGFQFLTVSADIVHIGAACTGIKDRLSADT